MMQETKVGDALCGDSAVADGFSGLIVDIFQEDRLPESLEEVHPCNNQLEAVLQDILALSKHCF